LRVRFGRLGSGGSRRRRGCGRLRCGDWRGDGCRFRFGDRDDAPRWRLGREYFHFHHDAITQDDSFAGKNHDDAAAARELTLRLTQALDQLVPIQPEERRLGLGGED
jgi:hypothetical protein